MAKTYQERLVAGLKAKGWVADAGDRSKYQAFTHAEKPGRKLFVGPNGALRSGDCASRSFSIGDAARQSEFYTAVLAAGDKALAPTVYE